MTAADGRYRLEYLRSGFHTMSLPGRGPAEVGLDLQANRSDVDFALT